MVHFEWSIKIEFKSVYIYIYIYERNQLYKVKKQCLWERFVIIEKLYKSFIYDAVNQKARVFDAWIAALYT